jgi:hypothetical protein
MPIKPKEDIVIPAKTLDKLWIIRVVVSAPSLGGDANAEIQLMPYNDQGETGEIIGVSINSILEEIQNGNEQLAAAYTAIMNAIQHKIDPDFVPEEE